MTSAYKRFISFEGRKHTSCNNQPFTALISKNRERIQFFPQAESSYSSVSSGCRASNHPMSNTAPKGELTYVGDYTAGCATPGQRRVSQEGGRVLDVLGGQYGLPSRLRGWALFLVRWDEDWQKSSGVSSLSALVLPSWCLLQMPELH